MASEDCGIAITFWSGRTLLALRLALGDAEEGWTAAVRARTAAKVSLMLPNMMSLCFVDYGYDECRLEVDIELEFRNENPGVG